MKGKLRAQSDFALVQWGRLPATLRQFVKFGMVGAIGFLVDSGVLKLCIEAFGLDPYTGRVISFILAASTTWFCNRIFTFRGQNNDAIHQQWLKFVIVSAGGFVFNYGAYAILMKTQPLVQAYPIAFFAGHEHIAPGRKADPGAGFDWVLMERQLQGLHLQFPEKI